jgi:hypothetical protein
MALLLLLLLLLLLQKIIIELCERSRRSLACVPFIELCMNVRP